MRSLIFTKQEAATYPVCILVPVIRKDDLRKAYIDTHNLDPNEILVTELHRTPGKKKTPASEMKQFINDELVPMWTDLATEFIIVADSEYFKILTKTSKADVNIGYVMDSAYGPQKVIYVPDYRQIFYDPAKIREKIGRGIEALKAYRNGAYEAPGEGIIHFAAYPTTPEEIEEWLLKLLEWNRPLTMDIEAFSLKHVTAGIGTISMAWSKHEGIAFPVDLGPDGELVRRMLKAFFMQFQNRMMWHKIDYDVYVLIYQLFMKDILDTEGLLEGIKYLLPEGRWDCTRIITYLATNSCAGNKLSLKDQAQEFSGNYALLDDDPDITKIPLPDLLKYNLIDALSTWYVYEKHWDTLIQDDQLGVYTEVFKPAMVDINQMQLTGLPVNIERVRETKKILLADYDEALEKILNSKIIQGFSYNLVEKWVTTMNAKWKKKRTTVSETLELAKTDAKLRDVLTFNPNSGPQLQALLYEHLGLPVLATTDSGQPATGGEVLKDLKNHTEDQDILNFLDALIDYGTVVTVLETFIPALEGAFQGPDGWHYLFGNFNLGGTISGRLSSSKPNLQNLPAGADPSSKKGKYGKLIKWCIQAPPGWIFIGLDFNALEDRISALTTKDPNKLKVYIDGYDGHSLRAYAYYGEDMPDIDPTSVESINSIQVKYKPHRAKSKNPTFTLTYQGTWKTLVTKYKFTEALAKQVEARYHELYKVSDQWVEAQLDQASKVGYVTIAFGLRLRTPLLHQVFRGTSKTPYEAEAEGRSAGNALGQSWCLLNSRAWSEFMQEVRQSPHRLTIRPCAQIHDAGYALVKDDIDALHFTNERLVKAVQWQEHPDIQHDQVKLGGELSIFYPDWSQELVIPNGSSQSEIIALIENYVAKLSK